MIIICSCFFIITSIPKDLFKIVINFSGQKDSENSAADQQLLQNQKEEIARERAEQLILEEENQKWIERERLAQEQWAKKQNTQENVLDRKQQEVGI